MNALLRKEGFFLGFLLHTKNKKQKTTLLRTIDKRQLHALIELIYNVLHGYEFPTAKVQALQRYRNVLRKLVSKALTKKQRVELLIKHFKAIETLLGNVKRNISVQWQQKS